jgi:probable phosphoglycerate mutase
MRGTLYLLRHGETVGNRSGRLQGQLDTPLTRLGLQQADAMGRALSEIIGGPPDHLIASPLGRTKQTAAIVCEHLALPFERVELDARLKEITLGRFDGAGGWDAVLAGLSESEKAAYAEDRWNFRYPNGESSQDVQDRVRPALADLIRRPGVTVVVAHGVVNKILRGLHLNLTQDETFALDRPQDALFKLHADGETRIDLDVIASVQVAEAI